MSTPPLVLGPNQPTQFYRGGAGIARFRGTPQPSPYSPEDWISSTTELWGRRGDGLTRLEDGRTLREAVSADPVAYLGPERAERSGGDPGLLVKLLNTGERLLVHFHPDRAFAARHLGCTHGKTEAWMILDVAEVPDDESAGHVFLGFRDEMDPAIVRRRVEDQDTEAILASLNKVPVAPGDTCLVPAGVPHGIGVGLTLVEIQEPTDLSILLEWKGYAIEGSTAGHLGLGYETALQALDYRAWSPESVSSLFVTRPDALVRSGVTRLLPPRADDFFRAERIELRAGVRAAESTGVADAVELEAAFSVLVATWGEGQLAWDGGVMPVRKGSTVLLPYSVGPVRLGGNLSLLRCLPAELEDPS